MLDPPKHLLLGLSGAGLALILAGCGGDRGGAAPDESPPARHGLELVAGTSLERYGLLLIPRQGGAAELRALEDPREVLWRGARELPAVAEARPLGASAVLRGADGTLFRYDPARDALQELERVSAEAEWSGLGDRGVWVDGEANAVVAVGADGAWRHELPRSLRWAAPVQEGGVVALVDEEDGPALWLLRPGEERPEATVRASVGAPGLVVAWGREVILTANAGDELVSFSVPALSETGRLELDGDVRALAASPSYHQLYASTASSPRVVAASRSASRVRALMRLERPAVALRPALFGDHLLAWDGARVWRLSLDGGRSEALDSEWRDDLPLALPGQRVLVVTGEEVQLVGTGSEPGNAGVGSADAFWVPVRWRPPQLPAVAARAREADPEEPGAAADQTAQEAPGGDPAVSAGEDSGPERPRESAGGEEGRAEAEVPPREGERATGDDRREDGGAAGPGEDAVGVEARTAAVLEAGFYAIAASSQRLPGVSDLARALTEAGYGARIQRHRDEAGEVWYRCLVGPYGSREAAEEVADQLRRERGIQAWITEVAPDARTEGIQR